MKPFRNSETFQQVGHGSVRPSSLLRRINLRNFFKFYRRASRKVRATKSLKMLGRLETYKFEPYPPHSLHSSGRIKSSHRLWEVWSLGNSARSHHLLGSKGSYRPLLKSQKRSSLWMNYLLKMLKSLQIWIRWKNLRGQISLLSEWGSLKISKGHLRSWTLQTLRRLWTSHSGRSQLRIS